MLIHPIYVAQKWYSFGGEPQEKEALESGSFAVQE
jgi:hypothetical protein